MTKTLPRSTPKKKAGRAGAARSEDAVEIFSRLLAENEARHDNDTHYNVTFLCGAGFSKSWDPRYPAGTQLFSGELPAGSYVVTEMCHTIGVDPRSVDLDGLKALIFAMNTYERYADLRGRYVDEQIIRVSRDELIDWVQRRFDDLVGTTSYWSDGQFKFSAPRKPTSDQASMLGFFQQLFDMADGSRGRYRGVRPHFLTTNYDFVLETLIDATMSSDPMFVWVYRGFSPVSIEGIEAVRSMPDHWLAHHLIKLNGGFELRDVGHGYSIDYRRRNYDAVFDRRPKIILPSRDQSYEDGYFADMFRKTARLLRESHMLVVVGYSFPEEDAALRFLIRQFAESAEDAVGKVIVVVDPAPPIDRVMKIFPSGPGYVPTILSFAGTFSSFAQAAMDRMNALRRS